MQPGSHHHHQWASSALPRQEEEAGFRRRRFLRRVAYAHVESGAGASADDGAEERRPTARRRAAQRRVALAVSWQAGTWTGRVAWFADWHVGRLVWTRLSVSVAVERAHVWVWRRDRRDAGAGGAGRAALVMWVRRVRVHFLHSTVQQCSISLPLCTLQRAVHHFQHRENNAHIRNNFMLSPPTPSPFKGIWPFECC
jgi:hypothetical protein